MPTVLFKTMTAAWAPHYMPRVGRTEKDATQQSRQQETVPRLPRKASQVATSDCR